MDRLSRVLGCLENAECGLARLEQGRRRELNTGGKRSTEGNGVQEREGMKERVGVSEAVRDVGERQTL